MGGRVLLISVHYDREPIILNNHLKGYNYQYINGQIKNKKFCRGYCNFNNHKGCLTEKMIKEHKCMEKACPFLFIPIKCDECEQKQRKIKDKTLNRRKTANERYIQNVCMKCLEEYENIKITRIDMDNSDYLKVRYVAVFGVDEEPIKSILESELHMNVRLCREKYDFSTCVEIVYGINV